MIFYFSGTGNSYDIARQVATELDDKLITMKVNEEELSSRKEYTLKENETLGFVFPIYAWGIPKIVKEYITNLTLHKSDNTYIYCIITCGDTIGNGMKQMKDLLKSHGLHLHSGFSITMPNNYIVMGNVDPNGIASEKLEESKTCVKDIINIIKKREKNYFNLKKGAAPMLLTNIINPLFNKFALDASKFYANDSCIRCGICANICKYKNIKIEDKPVWGDRCTQCLSCMHYCPRMAVQYGKGTVGKERYTHPEVTVAEMVAIKE